jgi:hypothetical protein
MSLAWRKARMLALGLVCLAAACNGTIDRGAGRDPDARSATPADGQTYALISAVGSGCLDDPGSSRRPAYPLRTFPCVDAAAQRIRFDRVGGDAWVLTLEASGLVIATEAGAGRIIQAVATGDARERWTLTAAGGGEYELVAGDGLRCLAVEDPSGGDGGYLVARECEPANAVEHWRLDEVSGPTTAPPAASFFIGGLADPSLVFYRGNYYNATGTFGRDLYVDRSTKLDTVSDLASPDHQSFHWASPDPNYKSEAPGLAVITDPRDGHEKLAVYLTNALPYPGTIEVLVTEDPKVGFESMGVLAGVAGYDAEYLELPDGRRYLLFATFVDPGSIAAIALADPFTTTGVSRIIAAPIGPSELYLEAPAVVIEGSTLDLVYSANYCCSASDPAHYYVEGLMTLPVDGDPLDPLAWSRSTAAVFGSADPLFAPGSGTFVRDAIQTWFSYSYWTDQNAAPPPRFERAQTVTFDSAGVVELGTAR